MTEDSHGRPTSTSRLRWLAARLVRGPHSELIIHDLEDLHARDRARGMSTWRAHWRYGRYLFHSAFSVWRADRPWPSTRDGEWKKAIRGGSMLQDWKFALRLFRKHPAPVGIAIGGLALAIGVVASVFTIVDASLLRPYGMDQPSSVVSVGRPGHGWRYWPYATFLKMRDEAVLTRVGAALDDKVRFSSVPAADGTSSRHILFVSGGYLQMLGGRPSLGRALEPSDDMAGAPPVIVVSHHFWSTELKADPSVVGKTMWLNGSGATLVGVLRPDFTGPVKVRPSVWAPFAVLDDVRGGPPLDATSRLSVEVVARLAPGVAARAAEENLSVIVKRSIPPGSTSSENPTGQLVQLNSAASPIASARGSDAAEAYTGLAIIISILGLVLAVACANTANLLLAAATTRMPEMGIRLALGASTRRLVRQMVSESVLLGLIAGGFGFLLAIWLVPILTTTLELELSPEFSAAPDGRVFLLTVAVAVLCGVGAGLSPARHGARGNVLSALKAQGPSGVAVSSRLRTSFVVFQAAVSMLMLVVAALLARTALHMTRIDTGFDADRLLAVSVEPPRSGFDQPVYFRAALAALREMPSVEHVSVAHYGPFGGGSGTLLVQAGNSYELSTNRTDADYFLTTGLRIRRGRTFTADEVTGDAPVAVISDSVARTFFPGSDAVGMSLSNVPARRGWQEHATIVGVVSDSLMTYLRSQDHGAIYRPIRQQQFGPSGVFTDQGVPHPPDLIIRTANPGRAARDVEDALRRIDPRVRTTTTSVSDRIEAFLGGKRMFASVFAPMAVLAVLLAALGVFGVTAFVASQRAKEVSLRIAMGASSTDVLRLLVKDSVRPVIIGLAVGLGLALVVCRVSASMFPGISPYDPLSIGGATVFLLAGALVAVAIPARRASKVDPASLLRQV